MNGPDAPRGFRQLRCAGCGLTAAACVCSLYRPLASSISVSVVMSRPEARSASNSARLLSLWLPEVTLHVRGGDDEVGDPAALAARAGSALLFPSGGRPTPLPGGVRHLIVPDGTWAQARRIERRCFAAEPLPRVSLAGPWPSVYALRRGGEGMCTFEAVAIALGLLQDAELGAVLLARFAEWARRAHHLKLGGLAPLAERRVEAPLPPHPAAALLRALPPDGADARLARLEGSLGGGLGRGPATGTDEDGAAAADDEQRGEHEQAVREGSAR